MSSAHPPSVFKGFAQGLARRILRRCQRKDDQGKFLKYYRTKLLNRGHDRLVIQKAFAQAAHAHFIATTFPTALGCSGTRVSKRNQGRFQITHSSSVSRGIGKVLQTLLPGAKLHLQASLVNFKSRQLAKIRC